MGIRWRSRVVLEVGMHIRVGALLCLVFLSRISIWGGTKHLSASSVEFPRTVLGAIMTYIP
jgi:hypothetical protein